MKLGILTTFLLVASGAAAWADDERSGRENEAQNVEKKSVKLPLKIEKGKEYAFRVEMDAKHGQQGSQGSQGREGQQGGQSQGFGIQQSGRTQFDYRMRVKEASNRESTIEFTVAPTSQGGQGREQTQSPITPGTFTVKVDQNGQLIQGDGLEELTGSRRPGQEGSQATGATAFTESMVRSQLRLILGTGLHASELRPATTLRLNQGAGSRESAGGGQEGTPRPGIQPREMDVLDPIQLRYEGTTKKGGEELAFFTVLPGDQSGTTPSSGRPGNIRPISAQEEGAEQERGSGQGAGGTGRTEGSLGNAAYQVDDGLLQRVIIQGQFQPSGQTGQSQSGQSVSQRIWIQIKRVN